MRLPFNLDFKSIVVGILIAYFVIPWVLTAIGRPRSSKPAA